LIYQQGNYINIQLKEN